ncbi:hypothetical protein DUNSADRAFT_13571 [Dunaliella salina]|uniref:Encoded protein n=1 Tax=Dunaliella salina TaxID=3046 RepID=A0ABQ7H354_DUNSA|nr:hypothetical protein DUNSADRAFT_13571 [Dunaliella salina]|eukprot:KAF5841298.1 hypothetical protein DUNSADRAFT_13571 [Dunaliella salina]
MQDLDAQLAQAGAARKRQRAENEPYETTFVATATPRFKFRGVAVAWPWRGRGVQPCTHARNVSNVPLQWLLPVATAWLFRSNWTI